MGRFSRLAALALAAGLWASPAAAIDPFFPTFGNNGIDVLHYDLDLAVTPGPGTLEGRAVLWIRAQRRLAELSLDLVGLEVSRVTVDSVPAGFEQADDKLIVRPDEPIRQGAVFRLRVAYAGRPEPIPDPTAPGSDIELGWFTFRDASYVVSEPVGASTFYPANDEPTDKATFSIAVTVPADYTAAANGVLRSVRATDTGQRFRWEMRQPMTTWLATVHVNQFRLQETNAADGTPIRVYYTALTPPADVDGYALAGEILTWMEPLVGRYPFGGYGSVVVDDPVLFYALETQAMSTFPLGSADEAIVAHELAHQWFGNSASIAKWEDLWLAEGTSTYFEVLWPNRDDPAAFDAAMLEIYDFVLANGIGPAVVGLAGRDVHRPDVPSWRIRPVRAPPGGRRSDVLPHPPAVRHDLSRSQRHLAGLHPPRGSGERPAVGRAAAAGVALRRGGAGAGRPGRGGRAGGPGRPAGRGGAPLRAGRAPRRARALRVAPGPSSLGAGVSAPRPMPVRSCPAAWSSSESAASPARNRSGCRAPSRRYRTATSPASRSRSGRCCRSRRCGGCRSAAE